MNTGNIILGVILVGICVLPFALVYFQKRKKQAIMLIALNEKAKEKNRKIKKHEFGRDFVIGLDGDKEYVFFHQHSKDTTTTQMVDLSQVRRCTPEKKIRSAQVGNQRTQIIENLSLIFTPVDESHKTIRFVLYDEDVHGQLSGQLQIMERWSEKIQDLIRAPVTLK